MSATGLTRALYAAQRGCCFDCGRPMSRRNWTREHVLPRGYGMRLHGNIVLAHWGCNHRRGDRLPSMAEISRALALWGRLPSGYRQHGDLREWAGAALAAAAA